VVAEFVHPANANAQIGQDALCKKPVILQAIAELPRSRKG
jgi:hypothetical protein